MKATRSPERTKLVTVLNGKPEAAPTPAEPSAAGRRPPKARQQRLQRQAAAPPAARCDRRGSAQRAL